MRIKTSYEKGEGTTLRLCEIYCNTVLETAEGNQIAICMRDDTIEFNIIKHHPCWWRIDMQTGSVFPLRNNESANSTETATANTAKVENTTEAEEESLCEFCGGRIVQIDNEMRCEKCNNLVMLL